MVRRYRSALERYLSGPAGTQDRDGEGEEGRQAGRSAAAGRSGVRRQQGTAGRLWDSLDDLERWG